MKLWLDDERPAPDGWTHVDTVEKATMWLEWMQPDSLSLDHDLGEGQPTGYDLVKWMAEHNIWPINKPTVHSANPVGRAAMEQLIERYWPNAPRHATSREQKE